MQSEAEKVVQKDFTAGEYYFLRCKYFFPLINPWWITSCLTTGAWRIVETETAQSSYWWTFTFGFVWPFFEKREYCLLTAKGSATGNLFLIESNVVLMATSCWQKKYMMLEIMLHSSNNCISGILESLDIILDIPCFDNIHHIIIIITCIVPVLTWFVPWLQLTGSRKFCIEGKRVRLASKKNWNFDTSFSWPFLIHYII